MLYTAKKIMHKLLGFYLIAGSTFIGLFSTASAQDNPGGTFLDTQDGLDGIKVSGAANGQVGSEGILTVVKNLINYALGLLGLIALIMLVYGGYKMVISGGDEAAYKEGLGILKNAAIGIAFIAVSFFLIQFIFYIIGVITKSS